MAKKDSEGFFYIVGRKKRFLKIFGNRVNLDEVEQMVKAAYPELECTCGGVDDRLYIFITDVMRNSEVKHFLSEKTGLNPMAFVVKYLPNIPKNEAGKTQYHVLEAYYD
jgi:acyl-coenzyme A synthetase/AMP-(fatty) acid ligase